MMVVLGPVRQSLIEMDQKNLEISGGEKIAYILTEDGKVQSQS